MDTISTGPLERDYEKFLTLLRAVRDSAVEDGHWKLVSVSLDARTLIDPLAVLESIYEPAERHFYMEHPESGEALAGAESVVEECFSGAGRFAQARDFARELFEHTVAVGQMDLPLAGPKLFCAFGFEDEAAGDAVYAPATLFVPRWQVSAADGAYVATANLLVTPDGDIETQARRALDAHKKFSGFHYGHDSGEGGNPVFPGDAFLHGPEARDEAYLSSVRDAMTAIGEGRCTKVVLSRRSRIACDTPPHPLHTLAALRERFPSCRAFSFSDKRGGAMIGASPERLVRIRDGVLETEALAGTAPRGTGATEDAALAAALIGSDKQMREHLAVADTIASRLETLELDAVRGRPRVLRLPNVQHIRTPFHAKVPDTLHLFDAAAALHPTPATSGLPRDTAKALLRQLEGADRGLYCGLTGWCDADGGGDLAVMLRSGYIGRSEVRLFSGAGIVQGSDPEDELQETKIKMSAVAGSLRS